MFFYLFLEKNGKELPIAFISKTLNPTEIKWSTTEKECYGNFSETRIFPTRYKNLH